MSEVADPGPHGGIVASAKKAASDASEHGWRTWWALVKHTMTAWIDDYAPSMGAALSYYTIFSLGPLLLIVVSVAGLLFGEEAVRGELFGQLQGLMGAEAAKALQDMLSSVSKPSSGAIGTITGVVLLLFGATTVFGELQDALDRIWRAPAREKSGGLWTLLRSRLLSLGMIMGLAFLLMVSLVLGAVISALGKWWGPLFGGWEVLAQIVNLLVGFALTTTVFAMIYKLMPRVTIRWHDVWLGAIVTSLLFTIGKFVIGLYIGKSGVASGFGAAASVIIVFIWVYYSAQIFLVGAEFTWVYARTLGSRRDLEPLTHGDLAQAEEPPRRTVTADDSARAPDPADVEAALAERRRAHSTTVLADVGAGVAFFIALRYVVPRLLRRL